MRGKSKNRTSMTGAPNNAIHPAVRAASAKEGLPTGMWAFTNTVSKPSRPSTILKAISKDCE